MIELFGIKKRYSSKVVLKDVSTAITDNSINVIMGPSGSGKSTLLRIIAGLIRPDCGLVKIDGLTMDDKDKYQEPHLRNLGFMFQQAALWPHMTVAENVGFGLLNLEKSQRQQRIFQVLKQVGMEDYPSKLPFQLSGGQARRVALARSLAPYPSHLLLDEPLSNLDDNARFELLDLVKQVAKEYKQSIVYVTHRQDEAKLLGGNQYYLDKGSLTRYE